MLATLPACRRACPCRRRRWRRLCPAAAAADPAALISELGNRALEVLGKNVGSTERAARFRQLFREDFDVPAIARFVLGRYWRTATEAEQQEFVRLFEDYIALAYANRLGRIQRRDVQGDRAAARMATASLVTSEIIRPNGAPPAKVDWRVTRADGAYKITDVDRRGRQHGRHPALGIRLGDPAQRRQGRGPAGGAARKRPPTAGARWPQRRHRSAQARVSGLYLMRCGWSASAPRRRWRSAS